MTKFPARTVSDGVHPLAEHVERARETLLSAEDSVCLQRAYLVAEAYRLHEGDPPAIKRATAFAHVLANMDLDLESNPIFAGNTSSAPRAWMLLPEYGWELHNWQPGRKNTSGEGASVRGMYDHQIIFENPDLAGLVDIDKLPGDLVDFWEGRQFGSAQSSAGHLAADIHAVVHEGLAVRIATVERLAEQGDADSQVYRKAIGICLRAVIDWAARYSKAAEQAAEQTNDESLRPLFLRIASACSRVPALPARNLFEGLQAIVLIHLAMAIEGQGVSVSIGLPDRVLAPFLNADTDLQEASYLAAAFMLKITSNSLYGRGSKTQAITIGGADHLGRDCSNPLTRCFLDGCLLARVGDPHLFLRWHSGLDQELRHRAAEMLASGASMPLLINDEPTVAGFLRSGVTEEDAWEYCVIGCNELGIPGRSADSSVSTGGQLLPLELLNNLLLEHPDLESLSSIDDLLQALEDRMVTQYRKSRHHARQRRRSMAAAMPTPFTSSLMLDCIEDGRDFLIGMRYRIPCVYTRGFTNAVNALAAIDQHVFQSQKLSLVDLVRAMRENFPDNSLRQLLLSAPKWGNDDDRVNKWAEALLEVFSRTLEKVRSEEGDLPYMVCHVVRSLHHLDGAKMGASPDGRLAGQPIADSIGAQIGTARRGPTGVLNATAKLDVTRHFSGGTNLNLTLPGDTEAENVLSLIQAFFENGGQELQINCMDPSTLRDAQEHPERYGELVVRVSGFSARFVDLNDIEQEELIKRAEAAGA